jgi:hypothetical protein
MTRTLWRDGFYGIAALGSVGRRMRAVKVQPQSGESRPCALQFTAGPASSVMPGITPLSTDG